MPAFDLNIIIMVLPSFVFLYFVLSRLSKSGKLVVMSLVVVFSLQSALLGAFVNWPTVLHKSNTELSVTEIIRNHPLPFPVIRDNGWMALVSDFKHTVHDALVLGRGFPDKAATAILEKMKAYNADAAMRMKVTDYDAIWRDSAEQQVQKEEKFFHVWNEANNGDLEVPSSVGSVSYPE